MTEHKSQRTNKTQKESKERRLPFRKGAREGQTTKHVW